MQYLDESGGRGSLEAVIKVWKTVKRQGKILEKSGNFEMEIEMQPCVIITLEHSIWLGYTVFIKNWNFCKK